MNVIPVWLMHYLKTINDHGVPFYKARIYFLIINSKDVDI